MFTGSGQTFNWLSHLPLVLSWQQNSETLFGLTMALGCCDTSICIFHTSTPHPSHTTPLTNITSLTPHSYISQVKKFCDEKSRCKSFMASFHRKILMRLTDTCASFLAAPIINVICPLLSVASHWLPHKWREGCLLPTWAQKITCQHFNWMLQPSSEP